MACSLGCNLARKGKSVTLNKRLRGTSLLAAGPMRFERQASGEDHRIEIAPKT